jgi:hypothetical protein
MSSVSTNLRFAGMPRPGTTIGGSEFRGTTHTTGVPGEGHRAKMERGNELETIQEGETSSSR